MQTMLFKQNREKCFLTLNTGCCFFCSKCWCGRPLGDSTRRCFSIRRFRFCLVQKKNVNFQCPLNSFRHIEYVMLNFHFHYVVQHILT